MNKHILDYKLKQIEVANTGQRLLLNKNVLDYKPMQIALANTGHRLLLSREKPK